VPERFQAGVAQTTRDRDADFPCKRLFLLDVSYWFQIAVAAAQLGRENPLSPRHVAFAGDEKRIESRAAVRKPWQASGKTVAGMTTRNKRAARASRIIPSPACWRGRKRFHGHARARRPREGGTHIILVSF
jgi:hypothetical protein